jgi:hypothetical protein
MIEYILFVRIMKHFESKSKTKMISKTNLKQNFLNKNKIIFHHKIVKFSIHFTPLALKLVENFLLFDSLVSSIH